MGETKLEATGLEPVITTLRSFSEAEAAEMRKAWQTMLGWCRSLPGDKEAEYDRLERQAEEQMAVLSGRARRRYEVSYNGTPGPWIQKKHPRTGPRRRR